MAAAFRIRPATEADAGAVAGLAAGLAQSFAFSRASFDAHYPALLADGHACLLVAVTGPGPVTSSGPATVAGPATTPVPATSTGPAAAPEVDCLGYLLGFEHMTFYANGRVAWAEEVMVRGDHRGRGVGRALMTVFERWAWERGCGLVALATRRAAPFYQALGYQDSAVYLRKLLGEER